MGRLYLTSSLSLPFSLSLFLSLLLPFLSLSLSLSLRPLLYYPPVNWAEVWSNRPTHMNGESDDQTTTSSSQNGTEPMETETLSVSTAGGGGGGVVLRDRGKRRAATVHGSRPQRSSYHEAVRTDEVMNTSRRMHGIFGERKRAYNWGLIV